MQKQFIAENEEGTHTIASALAKACFPGLIIFLQGPLGAGKTSFARGFIQSLGYAEKIKSPSYTIAESYSMADWTLHHLDLYRIHHPLELDSIGIQDYFDGEAITLVEWPEHGDGMLPPADIICALAPHLNGRRILIQTHSPKGKSALDTLQEFLCND
jgi:tRNA threonylcarbamoyladenosine biosynthesis protein TsaE